MYINLTQYILVL